MILNTKRGLEEGFVIRNGAIIFPATMTWNFTVNVLWAEVPSF